MLMLCFDYLIVLIGVFFRFDVGCGNLAFSLLWCYGLDGLEGFGFSYCLAVMVVSWCLG